MVIGGTEGDRTPDLRIANQTTGKTLSICLFESCSHRRKSRVFTFFPVPYNPVHVASCFFWSHIGHLEAEKLFRPRASHEQVLGDLMRRFSVGWQHRFHSIFLGLDWLPSSIAMGKNIGEDCQIHILPMLVAVYDDAIDERRYYQAQPRL